MGYHSKFSFNSNSDKVLQIRTHINLLVCGEGSDVFHWWTWGQGPKWYEQTNDCVFVSTLFPGEMFKIIRVGEEEGDNYTYTYLDGEERKREATEAEVREVEKGKENLLFVSKLLRKIRDLNYD